MRDEYDALTHAIARVDSLIAETGLDRDGAVDAKELSFHAGLSVDDVERLLSGSTVPAGDLPVVVAGRIRFAHATRLKHYIDERGCRVERHYTVAEICAACDMTKAWFGRITSESAPKVPNLEHTTSLAKLFAVPTEFFTDSPPKALHRVLTSRVIPHLETYVSVPLKAMEEKYGLVGLALRADRELAPDDAAALMAMIDRLSRRPGKD